MTPRNKPLLPLGAALPGFFLPCAQTLDNTAATPLPTVEAEASTANANTGGHRAASICKLVQLPTVVPQALTAMTGDPMQKGSAGTLREALNKAPGLAFNSDTGDRVGDNMNQRGSCACGGRDLGGADVAQYNRQTFNLEQVVLRRAPRGERELAVDFTDGDHKPAHRRAGS